MYNVVSFLVDSQQSCIEADSDLILFGIYTGISFGNQTHDDFSIFSVAIAVGVEYLRV